MPALAPMTMATFSLSGKSMSSLPRQVFDPISSSENERQERDPRPCPCFLGIGRSGFYSGARRSNPAELLRDAELEHTAQGYPVTKAATHYRRIIVEDIVDVERNGQVFEGTLPVTVRI